MDPLFEVDNPATGETFCQRTYLEQHQVEVVVSRAWATYQSWRRTSLSERIELVQRFASAFEAMSDAVAADITGQMGKPTAQARGEIAGLLSRTQAMCDSAPLALQQRQLPEKAGFERWVSREPLGIVLDIAAWNYPLLVPVNVVVAAVLAGNTVVLKHSPRTPLCGEHFERAFAAAGAPPGLVSAAMIDHATAATVIQDPRVGFVSFTGSVRGGKQVYATASQRVVGVGLELGGKDAAYVCSDANFDVAVANTSEGTFYNAGQSCCAVERILVDAAIYDRFIEAFVEKTRSDWRLGPPLSDEATMGPMALQGATATLENQVHDAVKSGGRLVLGGKPTTVDGRGRYFEPTIIVDAPLDSHLMQEESFGPIIGIQKVANSAEAVRIINDSDFGLTASIWTDDRERAEALATQLDVGTVFMNRCDFLDPDLPWTGVKDSGMGSSLGLEGFQQLTRPKAYHFRNRN